MFRSVMSHCCWSRFSSSLREQQAIPLSTAVVVACLFGLLGGRAHEQAMPSCMYRRVGSRAFLSDAVAEMLFAGATEHDALEVWKEGSLNWELFSAPVPPPQTHLDADDAGVYIDAARHLTRVARACAHFMRAPRARGLLEPQWPRGQRCHDATLGQLVSTTLRRYAGANGDGQPEVPGEVREMGEMREQEVREQQQNAVPLLACAIIERRLFGLYHHLHQEFPKSQCPNLILYTNQARALTFQNFLQCFIHLVIFFTRLGPWTDREGAAARGRERGVGPGKHERRRACCAKCCKTRPSQEILKSPLR